MSGFGPKLRAMWDDVSDLAAGDAVDVGGAQYVVSSIGEHDRVSGDVVVILESA
jgi:hypothetical protein